jgi:galactokinase
MQSSRKMKLTLIITVVLLGFAAAAFAYWTGVGSGSGAATVTTPSAVTVNQTNGAITNLYPGDPGQALSGDFDNPNAAKVYIHNVTAVVHTFSSQTDGSKPACTQADFSIGGAATVDAEVPAGSGVGSWSGLTVSLTDNAATNQDNCKGLSIQIDYTANAS